MIRRICHASFVTDDLPRLHHFYTAVLGLPVKIELRNRRGETLGYWFDCGGTSFIEVFDDELKAEQWNVERRPDPRGGRCDHLCLEVSDLHAYLEQLMAKGVEVGELYRGNGGTRIAWIRDPDGNRFELMEFVATSPQIRLDPGVSVFTIA